jgi:hypothetical protein
MKRALIALPLLALALGVALFLLRGTTPGPQFPKGHPLGPETAGGTGTTAPLKPPSPATTIQNPEDAPAGTIHFLVTLRNQPAAGVQITVQRQGVDQHAKFSTEKDGTQFLRGLPPGDYGIYIEHEDAIPYSAETAVASGQTAEIVVELQGGGRVYGTVTDRAGKPVPDTMVFLLDEASKLPPTSAYVRSDEKGQYALKGVPPGAFGVRYRHVLFKPLDRMGMVFRSASDEYRVDVVLEVGARISGRVVDEAGGPIEGAELIGSNGESAGVSKSAADGSFSVTGLTDIPANISAAKPGYGKVVKRNLSGNPTDVVFRLPKAGTVLGRLVIDQVPSQTHIILSRFDEELGQVVPAESRFFALPTTATFAFADVPPGTYWIDVQVQGYEPVDRPQIIVGSGQTTTPAVISMRKKN